MNCFTWTATLAIAGIGIGLQAPAAFAQSDPFPALTGQVSLASDYRFRGISQTGRDPALQASVSYEHASSGFYAGFWGSNVDFGVPDPDPATVEVDVFAGLRGEDLFGWNWDVGFIYYAYPGSDTGVGAPDYDYIEVQGWVSRTLGAATVSAGVNHSPDYFFGSGDFWYLNAGILWPVTESVSLVATAAHNGIEDNARFGTPDYLNWSAGVIAEVGDVSLDLRYIDTDIERTGCFGGSSACGETVLASLSFNF